jgi:hypothetical protein
MRNQNRTKGSLAVTAIIVAWLVSMAGLSRPVIAADVEAAALDANANFAFVGCSSIAGNFSWVDLPPDWTVKLLLQDEHYFPNIDAYTIAEFTNNGSTGAGSELFAYGFPTSAPDHWYLKVIVHDDGAGMLEKYIAFDFSRPCTNSGSVSAGGTGDGDGKPVDARSGVTSEANEPSSADDPDDDGRVQVP